MACPKQRIRSVSCWRALGCYTVFRSQGRPVNKKGRPMATECRIKCRLSPGLFADDVVARIRALGPDKEVGTVTVIVSRHMVSSTSRRSTCGTLRAYCTRAGRGFSAVVLPQASIENGQSVIVPSSEVVRA